MKREKSEKKEEEEEASFLINTKLTRQLHLINYNYV